MYKLLIVDDEDFEREGMAHLIDWGRSDIEMAGTAWNGVDAFQKIEKLRPDIVLTDIKMPVMDGIELIQKVRENYPDIEFAVLSGYGEYEYTSRAMEQGVKHYILKPCNEDQVIEVMEKVKKDVDAKRSQTCREEEYKRSIIPRARQQFFRNTLLRREAVGADKLSPELPENELPDHVRLLVFRSGESFVVLEGFVLGNMLAELSGNRKMKVYISTVVRNDTVIMISDTQPEALVPIACRIEREFARIRKEPVRAALSGSGDMEKLASLYQQTEELFQVGNRLQEPLLHLGMFDQKRQDVDSLVDVAVLRNARDYAQLLQNIQLMFLRMQQRGFAFAETRNFMDRVMHLLYQENLATDKEGLSEENKTENRQDLMICAVRQIYRHWEEEAADGRENRHYRRMLEEIYRHFQDRELSLHYLATEILYMNEDYCGRIFPKISGKKFTSFLLDARISVAEQLIELEPDMTLGTVAEMVGYAPDGQYFSKVFKKSRGVTPSEYREKIHMGME